MSFLVLAGGTPALRGLPVSPIAHFTTCQHAVRAGSIRAVHPARLFHHCPQCGRPATNPGANPFHCDACGFHYHFGPVVAAAAILLRPDGDALFVRRAKEPSIGRLALVGGFVDIGETAENALVRETSEEVGLEPLGFDFLCSHPNEYHYRGITCPVLDVFFVARVTDAPAKPDPAEVAEIVETNPFQLDPDELAFPSQQFALRTYQSRNTRQKR